MILLSLSFIAAFSLVIYLGYKCEPKNETSDIGIKYNILVSWINSCSSYSDLENINILIETFKDQYTNDKLLSFYSTKLYCKVQTKRIEILHKEAFKPLNRAA